MLRSKIAAAAALLTMAGAFVLARQRPEARPATVTQGTESHEDANAVDGGGRSTGQRPVRGVGPSHAPTAQDDAERSAMGTGIYDAAVFGDLGEVKRIVAARREAVNETDEHGFTALHGLAGEEHPEIAEFLIEHGANVNAANDQGVTPLHLAAWPAMAKLLLKSGANIEARTYSGATPLLVLAAEQDSSEVIGALLASGADANARGRDGQTALDIAVAREEGDKAALLRRYGGKRGGQL